MAATIPRSSCEKPLASVRARSTCSCSRRTYASTSTERSTCSGSAWITARIDSPVRLTTSARTRARPSTMTWSPDGLRAIWRMMPTVPIRFTWSGPGSSSSPSCSTSSSMRSPASARFTDSTDTGRFTASGCTLSGNATVPLSGNTGSSGGSGGMVDGDSGMRSWWVFHRKSAEPSTRLPRCRRMASWVGAGALQG